LSQFALIVLHESTKNSFLFYYNTKMYVLKEKLQKITPFARITKWI